MFACGAFVAATEETAMHDDERSIVSKKRGVSLVEPFSTTSPSSSFQSIGFNSTTTVPFRLTVSTMSASLVARTFSRRAMMDTSSLLRASKFAPQLGAIRLNSYYTPGKSAIRLKNSNSSMPVIL
jgi:hypothetical protein